MTATHRKRRAERPAGAAQTPPDGVETNGNCK